MPYEIRKTISTMLRMREGPLKVFGGGVPDACAQLMGIGFAFEVPSEGPCRVFALTDEGTEELNAIYADMLEAGALAWERRKKEMWQAELRKPITAPDF